MIKTSKLDFAPITFHAYELSQAFHFETPKEIFALRLLAWLLPERPVIVNIGAGAGTSGLCFAEARPDATIYTVDISTGGPTGGMENEKNAFAGLSLRRPIQILGDSKEVGKTWKHGAVSMVFVDGDHSYAGCIGDVEAWREHIELGGLIVFHDYTRAEWPDVYHVVEESDALAGFEYVFSVDTIWAGRKK